MGGEILGQIEWNMELAVKLRILKIGGKVGNTRSLLLISNDFKKSKVDCKPSICLREKN